MLEEIRPHFCLADWKSMYESIKTLDYFLPVYLPPDLHDRGFKSLFSLLSLSLSFSDLDRSSRLWLTEFFEIWLSIPNDTLWESVSANLEGPFAFHRCSLVSGQSLLSSRLVQHRFD